MRMSPYRYLLSLVLLMILSTAAMAQNRAIEGNVTDDQGQPLADVKITITGIDNPRNLETKTDKKGYFIYLLGLQSGKYRVVARKEGFQPMKEEDVKPEMRETVRVDFQLTPGADRKFPFEMTDEERKEYLEQYEARKKYQKFAAAVREHFDKGVELANNNQYEEAVAEFKEALELDPEQPAVHSRLGDAYKHLEKYAEAEASFKKAIELDPANGNLYSNLGDVLARQGKKEESVEAFKKAAEMNPNAGAQDLYNIGVTHYNDGNMEDAAIYFRKVIEKDPNYSEAYYLLATCLSGNMDTIPEAVDLFKQYIDLGGKPENVEVAKEMVKALKDYAK